MRTLQRLQNDLSARFLGSRELTGLPIRSRSKKAKLMVCEALKLQARSSFAKTSPRFPEENLDIAVQKATNFQLWNAELDPSRRYAFVILDEKDRVIAVRVLTGTQVAVFNTTGTQTLKHQAGFVDYATPGLRVIGPDTVQTLSLANRIKTGGVSVDPCAAPDSAFLKIQALGAGLEKMLGTTVVNPGADQERLRGQGLHEAVGKALGYPSHRDTGQHPDLPNQLLELKLQTSPTVDLGLIDPASIGLLGPPFDDSLRHADVRYGIFGAHAINGALVELVSLTLVPGERFFSVFRRFGGLGINKKLQMRLPEEWWG